MKNDPNFFVDDALTTAYGLYRDRNAWLPLHERVAILERAAQIIRALGSRVLTPQETRDRLGLIRRAPVG